MAVLHLRKHLIVITKRFSIGYRSLDDMRTQHILRVLHCKRCVLAGFVWVIQRG